MNNGTHFIATVKLTPRETEVLTLTAGGMTCRAIAGQLNVSEETIRRHIRNICRRLRAVNKTHAVALAMTQKQISPFRGIAAAPEHGLDCLLDSRKREPEAG